jgi:dTDP-4-dehydrorhamnose 3,5-epimerase
VLIELEAFKAIKLVSRKVSFDQRGTFRRVLDSQENEFLPKQISFSRNINPLTLRGMHFLDERKQEFKIVECVSGSLFDVIVDCREYSANYLDYTNIRLSEDSDFAVLIPPGFAHGYLTEEPNTSLIYQMSTEYDVQYEKGFRWDDPRVKIDWPFQPKYISDKDSSWKLL